MRTVFHLIETSGPGGAETAFVELMRGLDPSRWRCIAVIPPRRPDIPNSDWLEGQLRDSGLETIVLEEKRSFDASSFLRLARHVRRHGSPLIHAHLFGSAVRAALLSRIIGVPAIATLHGFGDVGDDERHRRLKFAIVNRGLRRVVFVSEPLRDAVLARHPLRPALAAVIPNGLDARRYLHTEGASFRAEMGLSTACFVIGSVGNLTPAKGIDVLLRAAAILKSRSSGYHFVVVGDLKGVHGERLIALRDSLDLSTDVTFAGFRSDVPRVMASFDVYALSSTSEGFSIALIEAMASGVPVVATRCGGPEHIIDHGVTGLLVDNGSPVDIAAGIERLRGSAIDRQRLAAAARHAVVRRFSMEAHVSAYERLYDSIATPLSAATGTTHA